jgi:hypothetical protein
MQLLLGLLRNTSLLQRGVAAVAIQQLLYGEDRGQHKMHRMQKVRKILPDCGNFHC